MEMTVTKIILCSPVNIIQFFMSEFVLMENKLFLVTVVWLWYALSSTRHSLGSVSTNAVFQ